MSYINIYNFIIGNLTWHQKPQPEDQNNQINLGDIKLSVDSNKQERENILMAIHGTPPKTLLHFDPLILQEVGNEVDALITNNNFKKADQNPENLEWNEIYKCWEYSVNLLEPEGRVIRVKLLDTNSTLKQSGQDYVNRINNLTESGIDLIKTLYPEHLTKTYINDIKKLQQILQPKLQQLDPANQEQHLLATDAFQAFNSELSFILNTLQKNNSCEAKLKRLGYIESHY
jgi:hypothetical protein